MILSDYVTGTITLENGEVAFTGTGTGWLAGGFQEGDVIFDITGATEYMGVIATITTDGAGTLTKAWEGPDLTAVQYRMRYQPDGSRVTAQARQLIELLGNGQLLSIADLDWTAGTQVIALNGAGSAVLVPTTDLVSGVAYDVQVDELADRAAYDAQATGYAVLVADVGDGRAAIYSKVSDTSGDWSDPAYVTGPVGPASTVPGVTWQGAYNPVTDYVANDGVLDNGSSWRAKIATTGNAPPVLPTTSNTQWELIAAKGTDGAGTGDVVGPAGVVNNRIAVYDGTTGKLLKDGGLAIADIVPAADSITNTILANMATLTIKGRLTAGTGNPEDLTPEQAREVLGLKWEPIGYDVISAPVAAWSKTDLSAYRFLRLVTYLRPSTADAYINFRTSTNNGVSYDATANDYSTINLIANGATVTSGQSTTESALTLTGSGATLPQGVVQMIDIQEFNKATWCFMETRGFALSSVGAKSLDFRNGARTQSTARDAIQLAFNTGNIASGVIMLDGIKG